MIRRLAVLLAALALAASAAPGAAAQQGGSAYEGAFAVPARPNPPRLVNDFTGTLAPGERDALERKLVAIDDSTGSQVAVVLVPTTDGRAPVDYATEILRQWGVGRAGTNDGVVLLVAIEDRDVFITTGYGAEGALTDAAASQIVRNVIVPEFRRGAYYAGIDRAADAIGAALSGQFEAPAARSSGGGDSQIGGVLCCLFILFVALVVMSSRHGPPPSSGSSGSSGRRRRRSGPGFILLPTGGWGGGSSGGFGGGFGGGGFGGGGFGGFGGGFGGGGGAGGSW